MQQKNSRVFYLLFILLLWARIVLNIPLHNSKYLQEWIKVDMCTFTSNCNAFKRYFWLKGADWVVLLVLLQL